MFLVKWCYWRSDGDGDWWRRNDSSGVRERVVVVWIRGEDCWRRKNGAGVGVRVAMVSDEGSRLLDEEKVERGVSGKEVVIRGGRVLVEFVEVVFVGGGVGVVLEVDRKLEGKEW